MFLFLKLVRKDKTESIFIFELPTYRLPDIRNVALGLYDRATIFLKRVGGIIVALSILLWVLVTFPQPPEHATMPAINYSLAGQLGHIIQPIFAPIGFYLGNLYRINSCYGCKGSCHCCFRCNLCYVWR